MAILLPLSTEYNITFHLEHQINRRMIDPQKLSIAVYSESSIDAKKPFDQQACSLISFYQLLHQLSSSGKKKSHSSNISTSKIKRFNRTSYNQSQWVLNFCKRSWPGPFEITFGLKKNIAWSQKSGKNWNPMPRGKKFLIGQK